jgi:uncharacterized protein YjiS (DUF1127 family)
MHVCPPTSGTSGDPRIASAGFAAWLARIAAWRAARRREVRALDELAAMNARELRDIGVEAADLYTLGVHAPDTWPR